MSAPTSAADAPVTDDLRRLARTVRPATLATERTLPVADPLAGLFPSAGLVRGSMVGITGPGATSLALALVAGPSRAGSWLGVWGWPTVGWSAAADYGIDLGRTVVVDRTSAGDAAPVAAILLEAFDVVVTPARSLTATVVRRLPARVREGGAVLVVVGPGGPHAPDVVLEVVDACWSGVGRGHGHLRGRRIAVRSSGRRGAARPRTASLWMPTATGELAAGGTATGELAAGGTATGESARPPGLRLV